MRYRLSLVGAVLALLLSVLPLTEGQVQAASVIYVDATAMGNNNGTSWANAYTDVQAALAAASSGDDIWVAAGAYTPGDNRSASFVLKNDVAVYGGFTGTETALDERNPDPATNGTILSGDMNGDDQDGDGDGIADMNLDDNSYHVMISSGTNSSAVLDGVTITGGNADGSFPSDLGGGIYNVSGNPTLLNLTISGNSAFNGGGIYNGGGSPTLTNVTISGNTTSIGGGMHNYQSNPMLTNVTISGNTAYNGGGIAHSLSIGLLTNVIISGNVADEGGGITNGGSNPTLTNVTISGNTAWSGGGIYNSRSNATVQNSIIWGNTAGTGSQIVNQSNSTLLIQFSLVAGGITGAGMVNEDATSQVIDGGNNRGGDPLFVAPAPANSAPTTSGNYRLRPGSAAIDQGKNDLNTTPTDRDRNPRIVGDAIDLGAYEAAPVPQVSITATDASGSETGSDPLTFTLTRSGPMTATLAVSVTISGSATNGTDYTPALSSPITIAAGHASQVITLTPVDDTLAEMPETVTLTLQQGPDYTINSTAGSATGVISDNDSATAPGKRVYMPLVGQ